MFRRGMGFYVGGFIIPTNLTRILIPDPCRFGFPEMLTTLSETAATWCATVSFRRPDNRNLLVRNPPPKKIGVLLRTLYESRDSVYRSYIASTASLHKA